MELIGAAIMKKGLRLQAGMDTGSYSNRVKTSDAERNAPVQGGPIATGNGTILSGREFCKNLFKIC